MNGSDTTYFPSRNANELDTYGFDVSILNCNKIILKCLIYILRAIWIKYFTIIHKRVLKIHLKSMYEK